MTTSLDSNTQHIFGEVVSVLEQHLSLEGVEVTPASDLANDLGAESLEVTEVIMGIEDRFGVVISVKDADRLKTVGDLVNFIKSFQSPENSQVNTAGLRTDTIA